MPRAAAGRPAGLPMRGTSSDAADHAEGGGDGGVGGVGGAGPEAGAVVATAAGHAAAVEAVADAGRLAERSVGIRALYPVERGVVGE